MKINPPYKIDLINAAMGAQRLSNDAVAKKAGVGPVTVSKIRNGKPTVRYATLKSCRSNWSDSGRNLEPEIELSCSALLCHFFVGWY